jgi:hypothetical protein
MSDRVAYSPDEWAEKAGISRSSVFAAIAAGALKARKSGHRTLILHDEGLEFLKGLPIVERKSQGTEV